MLQSVIVAKISGHVENHFDYFLPVFHIVQFTGQNFHTPPLEDIFYIFYLKNIKHFPC